MKVTKAEVQEVIDEIAVGRGGAPIEVDIKLGIEDDGDMVIVLPTTETNTNVILEMHRKVRKLGRRHNEAYYVEMMWPSWFNHYQQTSGFEELQEAVAPYSCPPCPLDVRFPSNQLAGKLEVYWEGEFLGLMSVENLDWLIKTLSEYQGKAEEG